MGIYFADAFFAGFGAGIKMECAAFNDRGKGSFFSVQFFGQQGDCVPGIGKSGTDGGRLLCTCDGSDGLLGGIGVSVDKACRRLCRSG